MTSTLLARLGGRDEEAGFTLVELVVTMMVISVVLLGLIGVQVSALGTVTLSRERQQATDLANRTMEQMRALPYDIVTAGSRTTDPSLSADPNIVSGMFRPTYDSSINEHLVTNATAVPANEQAPLYPHLHVDDHTRIGPVQFTVASYVTLVSATAGDTSEGYWLTAVVTWSSARTNGATKTVSARSQLFSPSGCGYASVAHPFSGPCQTFFDATAGTTPAGISITSDVEGAPALAGNDLRSAQISLPSLSSVIQSEQTVSTQSKTVTSGAKFSSASGQTAQGEAAASTGATTDPATGQGTQPAAAAVTQSGSSVLSTGTDSVFKLDAGSSDAGKAASTTAATSTTECYTVAGLKVTSNQVCSSGEVQQGGSLSATLNLGATIPLASVAPSTAPARALAARYTTNGNPYCVSASAVGCIAADVKRSIGTALVGGLPAGATGAPAGFSSMVSVTGYSDTARAESGLGATLLAGLQTGTKRSGTLSYWGPAGLASLDLATAAPQSITLSDVTYTYSGPMDVPVQVRMFGEVRFGASAVTPSGADPCQPEACGVSSSSGSLVADVSYEITSDSGVLGQFTVTLDLGSALAKTTYRAAPSA